MMNFNLGHCDYSAHFSGTLLQKIGSCDISIQYVSLFSLLFCSHTSGPWSLSKGIFFLGFCSYLFRVQLLGPVGCFHHLYIIKTSSWFMFALSVLKDIPSLLHITSYYSFHTLQIFLWGEFSHWIPGNCKYGLQLYYYFIKMFI